MTKFEPMNPSPPVTRTLKSMKIGSHQPSKRVARQTSKILLYRKTDWRFGFISGVRVYNVKKSVDERGYFAELFRDDWREVIGDDRIAQLSLSYSHPGVIRAWHRHFKAQNYYVICI